MSLELWLIRHGETDVNSGSWSAKPSETHLTDRGRAQAKQMAADIVKPPDRLIVSPLCRAQETAQYIVEKWPEILYTTQPIQEIMYLSPKRLQSLSADERQEEIAAYWNTADPYYCDGDDAESFSDFLQRVAAFYESIVKQNGFVIVVGHGQFFKAYQLGLIHGFKPNAQWMRVFREAQTSNPMRNGSILQLKL